MKPVDFLLLIHPAIAVICVFPLLGIVVNRAWYTRQRRLQTTEGGSSKIPPVVGREHVQIGKWLSSVVVFVTLLGIAHPTGEYIFTEQLWTKNLFQLVFLVLMFVFTLASLALLHRARQKHWRGIFATLTGMGTVILGWQNWVFKRENEWYWSHFYYGIIVAMLMIFSLAIIEDIYQDRSNRWRYVHITLNCFALLLFIGQGMTGVRDILEIGVYKLGAK